MAKRNPKAGKAAARGRRQRAATAQPASPAARAGPAGRRRAAPKGSSGPEERLHGPPSSLDLDRRATAARSGRAGLAERLRQSTKAGRVVAGGDVDTDWQAAGNAGDEAPGGDNPTPDQQVVEDIGRALGIEYDDAEELKGADKVAARDRHRWELDPASSEDYCERTRPPHRPRQ